MNKHILMVIDNQLNPDKYTQEQLKQNADAAYDANDADAAFVADDFYAANANACACAYAAANTAAIDYAAADYWLDRYFKQTCENKQDYIDEINKDNK